MVSFVIALSSASAQDLKAREEEAMRAAVQRVDPSVVQIQTIGGLEKVGKVLIGKGPTTGLIVSEDGLILSSAFNFVQEPSSIIVTLPGGRRAPASLVATDHSRLLVLLKVETEEKLSVPQIAPESEMKPGAWAIAVGRTFDGGETNMSVGVISALKRNYGKAIQTDAKISPSNYGGPLIDIRGRVLGVLAPMSPKNSSKIAGVEWYDGGIGFAVPLEAMQEVLPRLRKGEDLHPGKLGVNLTQGDAYAIPAELAIVHPHSPADKAGLKVGDQLVEVEGKPVATQMQFRLAIGPHYAGDTVSVTVKRGEDRIEKEIELTDKLEPRIAAMLGVLPSTSQADKVEAPDETEEGIAVRFVYPQSGAAEAGIKVGDRIIGLDDESIKKLADARKQLTTRTAGDELSVRLLRDGEETAVVVTLSPLPTEIPEEIPRGKVSTTKFDLEKPIVGLSHPQLSEFKNQATLYVPETYDPNRKYGLVVHLNSVGGASEEELLDQWKSQCQKHDLILLALQSVDPTKWQRIEAEYVEKIVAQIKADYSVDPSRILAHGYQAGGAMAYEVALSHPDVFSGIAAIEAPLPMLLDVPVASPANRLMIYSAQAEKSRHANRIAVGLKKLDDAKYPVTKRSLDSKAKTLNTEEQNELVRWMESLNVL